MRTDLPALALTLLLCGAIAATADETADELQRLEDHYRGSLVHVSYRQKVIRTTAEPPEEGELTTTGVVVTPDGVVMVSAVIFEPFNQVPHGIGIRFPASVARPEAEIADARIAFVDGTEYPATLIGRDPHVEVAFFRIDSDELNLTPVEFRPDGKVTVGQRVAVLSLLPDPLGPALAVELSRVQAMTSRPQKGFVVATGAADPVGGLVVSLSGDVLGYLDALTIPVPETRSRNPLAFISMIRDLPKGVGRGFARPAVDFVDASVKQTTSASKRRGWLGIEMQALSPELADHMGLPVDRGILLGYVYRNSPAESAGLEVGDVLTELGNEPIDVRRDEDIGAFAEKILRAGAGAHLDVQFLRKGEPQTTVVTLEEAPRSAREARTIKAEELDLTVRELTYDYLATRFLEPDQQGVVVVQPPVAVSSNPNRVAPGDLLVRLGDIPVTDLDAFQRAMDVIRENKLEEVVLFLERGRESYFFAVKPEWH
jgi:serine protease Do